MSDGDLRAREAVRVLLLLREVSHGGRRTVVDAENNFVRVKHWFSCSFLRHCTNVTCTVGVEMVGAVLPYQTSKERNKTFTNFVVV